MCEKFDIIGERDNCAFSVQSKTPAILLPLGTKTMQARESEDKRKV